MIWHLYTQNPQGQTRMSPNSFLCFPHSDFPLFSFFLNSISDLLTKTTFLQPSGTLGYRMRAKLIYLECLAFLYLYQGEASSFTPHITPTHRADWRIPHSPIAMDTFWDVWQFRILLYPCGTPTLRVGLL